MHTKPQHLNNTITQNPHPQTQANQTIQTTKRTNIRNNKHKQHLKPKPTQITNKTNKLIQTNNRTAPQSKYPQTKHSPTTSNH